MFTFTVRKLKMEDLEKGFFETLSSLIPVGNLSLDRARGIYNRISENPVYTIFVAENQDGQIIGATTLLIEQKFIANAACMAHIEDVATRKGFEKQGVGRALVKAAVQEAKNRGCFRVDLSCSDENVRFYENCGFKKDENEMRIWFVSLEELIEKSK